MTDRQLFQETQTASSNGDSGCPIRPICLLRRWFCVALGLSAAVLVATPGTIGAQERLNVATWGGAYGQSQERALFGPFAKETGIAVATQLYDGDLAKLKPLIDGTKPPTDVVDLSAAALASLCRQGLLEPLDSSSLAPGPDGAAVDADFYPGAVSSCGVASMAWSMAIAFDRRDFRSGPPTAISALLDTRSFPGKRALPRNPRFTLELALLASGVSPEDVYRELSTPEGADRAFAALDKIKDDVLLWSKAEEPITWLIKGRASMAAGYSGRLFRAAVGNRDIGILWDGQVFDVDAWAIPKASENKENATRFIRFVTSPEQLAAQSALIAYGPMRKSAVALVGKHPVLDVPMQEFLPTAPQNFAKALQFNESWWETNEAGLSERFAAWEKEVDAAAAKRDAERNAEEAAADKPKR